MTLVCQESWKLLTLPWGCSYLHQPPPRWRGPRRQPWPGFRPEPVFPVGVVQFAWLGPGRGPPPGLAPVLLGWPTALCILPFSVPAVVPSAQTEASLKHDDYYCRALGVRCPPHPDCPRTPACLPVCLCLGGASSGIPTHGSAVRGEGGGGGGVLAAMSGLDVTLSSIRTIITFSIRVKILYSRGNIFSIFPCKWCCHSLFFRT